MGMCLCSKSEYIEDDKLLIEHGYDIPYIDEHEGGIYIIWNGNDYNHVEALPLYSCTIAISDSREKIRKAIAIMNEILHYRKIKMRAQLFKNKEGGFRVIAIHEGSRINTSI